MTARPLVLDCRVRRGGPCPGGARPAGAQGRGLWEQRVEDAGLCWGPTQRTSGWRSPAAEGEGQERQVQRGSGCGSLAASGTRGFQPGAGTSLGLEGGGGLPGGCSRPPVEGGWARGRSPAPGHGGWHMARSTATEIFRGFCTLRSSEDGAKRPDAQVSSFLELPIQGSVVGEALELRFHGCSRGRE